MVMVLINDEDPSSADEEELLKRYKSGKNPNKNDLIMWEKCHREYQEAFEYLNKLYFQKSELETQINKVKRMKEEEYENTSIADSLGGRVDLLRNHNSEFSKKAWDS